FSFMWDECWIKMSSMNRLAGLTFLSSMLFFAWRATTDFSEISYSKIVGLGGLSGGLSELFAQSTLGMGACVVLYLTSSFFETTLQKRKALWHHLCAKVEAENRKEG